MIARIDICKELATTTCIPPNVNPSTSSFFNLFILQPLLLQEHQRYVQSVRYSPDGNFWASGGFDGKIYLYEAKDSELIGEFTDDAVKGKKKLITYVTFV